MDIRQLHYFLVLCDEMNYSRAAQRLFLSRQALRQSISAPVSYTHLTPQARRSSPFWHRR